MRLLLLVVVLTGVFVAGCGRPGQVTEEEQKAMQDAMALGDQPFDIENVPPEAREKVRGLMGGQPPSGN